MHLVWDNYIALTKRRKNKQKKVSMTEARSKISLLETKSSEKPMVCIYVNDELDMTDMTSFDQRNPVDETRSNKARKNPIPFEEFLVDGCKYFYDSLISHFI